MSNSGKNVEHHLFTPIVEHASNGTNYVIFGNRVEGESNFFFLLFSFFHHNNFTNSHLGDILVARTSQVSYTDNKTEKLRMEFSGFAHMSYVVFESDVSNMIIY